MCKEKETLADRMLASLEQLHEMLDEVHGMEQEADHYGDGPERCVYCAALEKSRAVIAEAKANTNLTSMMKAEDENFREDAPDIGQEGVVDRSPGRHITIKRHKDGGVVLTAKEVEGPSGQEGVCPKCGASVEYEGPNDFDGTGVKSPCVCTECGWHGWETYKWTGHIDGR